MMWATTASLSDETHGHFTDVPLKKSTIFVVQGIDSPLIIVGYLMAF